MFQIDFMIIFIHYFFFITSIDAYERDAWYQSHIEKRLDKIMTP